MADLHPSLQAAIDSGDNPVSQPGLTTTTTPGAGGLEGQLQRSAEGIEAEENRRGAAAESTIQGAFDRSQGVMANLIDPDLMFSALSDSIGARGQSALEGLRRSLSGRGISAKSAGAQGLLSRLAGATEGQLIGAQRDTMFENQRQRNINAATNFSNATTLAAVQGRPVSGVRHATIQDLIEKGLAEKGIAAGVSSQRATSRDNKMGSLGGGLLGLAGGIFGKGK